MAGPVACNFVRFAAYDVKADKLHSLLVPTLLLHYTLHSLCISRCVLLCAPAPSPIGFPVDVTHALAVCFPLCLLLSFTAPPTLFYALYLFSYALTLIGETTDYLSNKFIFRNDTTSYRLRNSEMRLALPQPRTDYVAKRFSYSGAALWNSLPTDIRVFKTLG